MAWIKINSLTSHYVSKVSIHYWSEILVAVERVLDCYFCGWDGPL
jgi:hypothetical protein